MTRRVPYLNSRLQGLGTTVFATMSALAEETGAVNLGRGDPTLRQAIADHQQRFYGLTYDPDREVLVTAGATEALAASILSLCEVGDEILAFEPYYDGYPALAAMAGAIPRFVPLRPP